MNKELLVFQQTLIILKFKMTSNLLFEWEIFFRENQKIQPILMNMKRSFRTQ
jgi:hypothetical protein